MPNLIIGGKRYILEKRNLLCEAAICNPDVFMDFKSKTVKLYYPRGKAFILDTEHDLTGRHDPPKIITKAEAIAFMNKHPEGIKESVYVRYFGKPEEL